MNELQTIRDYMIESTCPACRGAGRTQDYYYDGVYCTRTYPCRLCNETGKVYAMNNELKLQKQERLQEMIRQQKELDYEALGKELGK